jgi:hypothetical protein
MIELGGKSEDADADLDQRDVRIGFWTKLELERMNDNFVAALKRAPEGRRSPPQAVRVTGRRAAGSTAAE